LISQLVTILTALSFDLAILTLIRLLILTILTPKTTIDFKYLTLLRCTPNPTSLNIYNNAAKYNNTEETCRSNCFKLLNLWNDTNLTTSHLPGTYKGSGLNCSQNLNHITNPSKDSTINCTEKLLHSS
jgi:hypothetical protein